tara:strand:+ start:1399 stop:2349 length:951 start_codon:yes stop_codon:yes gene_type:complete
MAQQKLELNRDEEKVSVGEDAFEEKQLDVEKVSEEKDVKLEEVDLGYTDPVKKDTEAKIETKEEKTAEPKSNLNEVSESVQRRIDQLTRKYREAERREKAALDYAKGLQDKYSKAEKTINSVDTNYIKEFDARIDAQREQVKSNLKAAIENNDVDKITEANDLLAKLSVEKEKARILTEQKKEADQSKEQQQEQPKIEQPKIEQPRKEPTGKAKDWAQKNTWFGKDKVMTSAAYGIHEDLIAQGFDPESEDYYNEINFKMREYFPNKFEVEQRPPQTVASAGRKQEGRRTVKLTRSQVAIAKKLGVPLEEYAKFVK